MTSHLSPPDSGSHHRDGRRRRLRSLRVWEHPLVASLGRGGGGGGGGGGSPSFSSPSRSKEYQHRRRREQGEGKEEGKEERDDEERYADGQISMHARRAAVNVVTMAVVFVAFHNKWTSAGVEYLHSEFGISSAAPSLLYYSVMLICLVNFVDALRLRLAMTTTTTTTTMTTGVPVSQRQKKLLGVDAVVHVESSSSSSSTGTSSLASPGGAGPGTEEVRNRAPLGLSTPSRQDAAAMSSSPSQTTTMTSTPVTSQKTAGALSSPLTNPFRSSVSSHDKQQALLLSPTSSPATFAAATPQSLSQPPRTPSTMGSSTPARSRISSPTSPFVAKSPLSSPSVLSQPRSGSTPVKKPAFQEEMTQEPLTYEPSQRRGSLGLYDLAGYRSMEYSLPPIPKYMTAVREMEPSSSFRSGMAPQDAEDLLIRLGISSEFEDWREQLRLWLSSTLIGQLEKRMDANDAHLDEMQLPNLKIRAGPLNQQILATTPIPAYQFLSNNANVRTVADLMMIRPDVNQVFTERLNLEAYVVLSRDFPRDYVVDRIRALSVGQVLSAYSWNSGGNWGNREWKSDKLPTDAELVMHIFCTFMDEQFMVENHPYRASRTFRDHYYISEIAGRQRIIDTPGGVAIRRLTEYPPFWDILAQIEGKRETWNVAQGHSNLFDAILLFVFYVKTYKSGYIGSINLGGSSIGLVNVIQVRTTDI